MNIGHVLGGVKRAIKMLARPNEQRAPSLRPRADEGSSDLMRREIHAQGPSRLYVECASNDERREKGIAASKQSNGLRRANATARCLAQTINKRVPLLACQAVLDAVCGTAPR